MSEYSEISETLALALTAGVLPPLVAGADVEEAIWHHAAKDTGTDSVHMIYSTDDHGNIWWLGAPTQALTSPQDGAALAVALPGHPAHGGLGGYLLPVAGREDHVAVLLLVTEDGPLLYRGHPSNMAQVCRDKDVLMFPAEGMVTDHWQSFGFARERMLATLLSGIGLIGWRTAAFTTILPLIAGISLWLAANNEESTATTHNRLRAVQVKQLTRLSVDPYQAALARLDAIVSALSVEQGTLRAFRWRQATAEEVPSLEWVAELHATRPSDGTLAAFGSGTTAAVNADGNGWRVKGQ